MNKLKTGLVGAAGLAIGIVTLRKLRQRRSTSSDDAETAVEAAVEEAETTGDHLAAAARHAGAAVKIALEDAREDVDVPIEAPRDEEASGDGSPESRIGKVRDGLLRR